MGSPAPAQSRVGYTLVAANSTLVQGQYRPPEPGQLSGAAYDPDTGEVYVGDGGGSYLFGVNGSSGRLVSTTYVGWGATALAYDSLDHELLAEAYAGIVAVDPSQPSELHTLSGNTGASAGGLLFDPINGYAYGVDFGDGLVLVINASSVSYVTNISVGAGPTALALDPVDGLLYVANSNYGSVSVIDTATNRVIVGQVKVGGYPNCLAYDPLHGYIYVGSDEYGASNTTVLGAANHTVVQSGLATGNCLSMSFDPANGHVYVGTDGGTISDLNGTSLSLTGIRDPYGATGLAYDLSSRLMVAANGGDNSLTLFDATTGMLEAAHTPLSVSLLRATYDPLNADLYVATPDPGLQCVTPGTLTIVNASTHPAITDTIPVGYGPVASVVSTGSGRIFVADACSNAVTVVDGRTQTVVVPSVPVGTYPIALGYDPNHDEVWVANAYSDNVTVLNGTTGTVVVPSIGVGGSPDAVAVDPTNGWVYVADAATSNVTIINSSSDATIGSGVPVGAGPQSIVFNAAGNTMIVANSDSDNLTVLNASTGAVSVASVYAGVGPVALALDAADQLLYVADSAGGTVVVVDLMNDSVLGSPTPVGYDPQGIAYAPSTGQVDVSDFREGTISILADVPTIRSFDAAPSMLEVARTTVLSVNASENGGSISSYAYSGLPPGCLSADASALVCSPVASGSFRVTVTAAEPRGYTGWASLVLPVAARFAVANLSASPSPIAIGGNLTISIRVAGGVAPFTYYYSGLPPGCAGTNVSELNCTPSIAGDYRVGALITDALAAIAVASTNLTVTNPPPPAPLRILSFFPTQPNVEVNTSVTFQAVVVGGVDPVSIRYTGLPPGCLSLDFANLTCSPSATGSYLVTLVATDSEGATTSASTLLTVSNPPPPLAVALFAATPNPWTDGQTVVFQVVTTGGTPPLTYSYGGLPDGCVSANSPRLSCTPSGPHLKATVTVFVSDLFSRGAFASLNLSWTFSGATQTPPASTGGITALEWAAGIALGAVAGVAVSFAVLWIRKRPRS